jgi:hypothetical protein
MLLTPTRDVPDSSISRRSAPLSLLSAPSLPPGKYRLQATNAASDIPCESTFTIILPCHSAQKLSRLGVINIRTATSHLLPHEITYLRIALMMGTARTSETFVNFYQTTRRYNPEDSHLCIHRRENLKSY